MPKIKGVFDNRRGFTLVEIIVVLAIFSIVVVGGSSLLLSGNQVFKKNADMSHASQMAQYTIDWMEDSLTYSSVVEVTNGGVQVPAGMNAIKIQESGLNQGQLMMYKDGVWGAVFTAGFYEGWKIQIYPSIQDSNLQLRLEIVNRQDEKTYEVTKTMSFPNMVSSQNLKGSASIPYPMFLLSNDTPIPELPSEDTPENTPEVFYIGNDPEYPVPSNGDIAGYVNSQGEWGALLQNGSIYYDLGGYVTPYGETLPAGYYITRWSQYLTPEQAADPDYVYRYLYGVFDTTGNGEIKYQNKKIDSNPNYFIQAPVYLVQPYGQLININVDPNNVPEPSRYTQPGDLRRIGDTFYVFFPQPSRYYRDFDAMQNWIEIDRTTIEF
jgi:prepilin-type N-terminal cleavage/methylation domain-containing protein